MSASSRPGHRDNPGRPGASGEPTRLNSASACSASRASWVAQTTAAPYSAAARRRSVATAERVRLVEPGGRLVGQHDAGAGQRARATATRCRSPAESRADLQPQPVAEADRLERGGGALGRLVGGSSFSASASSTFSIAVRNGTSPSCWPITATCSRLNAARSARSSAPSRVPSATISPLVRGGEPPSRCEQRRLAGARRPGQREHRPRGNGDVEPLEERALLPPVADRLRDGTRLERDLARSALAGSLAQLARRRGCRVGRRDDDPVAVDASPARGADAGAEQQLLGQAEPAAAADDDRSPRGRLARPDGRTLTRPSRIRTTRSAIARHRRVVRDDDRGAALLADELREQVVGEQRVRAVELAGRLVGEQQLRPVRQRRAHGDALLLAAGELARPRVAALRARRARAARRPAGAFRSAARRQGRLERDELARAEVRVERAPVVLLDVAEPPRAVLRPAPPALRGEVVPEHPQRPGRRLLEAGEQPQQRRLARAARAEDCRDLPLVDRQRQPLQRGRVPLRALVDVEDVARLDRRLVIRLLPA